MRIRPAYQNLRKASLIKYGRLYNWPAAAHANIAPVGWSVPTRTNFATLHNYINTTYNVAPNDFGVGNHLRHRRQVSSPLGGEFATSTHPRWNANANYGRDTVLFGLLPASNSYTSGLADFAYLWASNQRDTNNGDFYLVTIGSPNFSYSFTIKTASYSIRCFRTAATWEQALPDGTHRGQVTDIDGNVYDTVKIGTQVWFVQNLATTRLNDGTPITLVTSGAMSDSVANYANYNNDTANVFFASHLDSIWKPKDFEFESAVFNLAATGDGSGVSTLRMQASTTTTLTLAGDANFYTDSGGTTGESKTWEITSGALRTIYLKCTNTATLTIPNQKLITHWGNSLTDGWTSSTNAASISSSGFPLRNLIQLNITGTSSFVGALPTGLTYLRLDGGSINWTYSGALPTGLTQLYLSGNSINWTYYDVSGTGSISLFSLLNFVTTSMTATQLITLLTSMAGRTGNLPATCTIDDYSNSPTAATIAAATGDVNGTDAEKAKFWITEIFRLKSTTRITLQGTNIDKP